MGAALTSLPKWRPGILLSVSAFNHERAPIYAYSDSFPTNSLSGQTMMYNGTLSIGSSSSDGLQHSEHHECGVASVSIAPLAGYDAKATSVKCNV